MVTSKTASSPPCSLNFSLKFPPVFRTDPEVSEYKKNIKILRRCFSIKVPQKNIYTHTFNGTIGALQRRLKLVLDQLEAA